MGSNTASTTDKRKVIVYLVRHGESQSNETMGREELQDTKESQLTSLGRKQAARTGEHLADVKFDYAYSSDYVRALDTAKIIMSYQKTDTQIQPEICKELREVDMGTLNGAKYTDILQNFIEQKVPLEEWVLPEGESIPDAGKRMVQQFEEICATPLESNDGTSIKPETNVLIVSHSMAVLSFLNFLTLTPHPHTVHNWDGGADLKIIKNCCYYKFGVSKGSKSPGKHASASSLPLEVYVFEKYYSDHLAEPTEDGEVLNLSPWKKPYKQDNAEEIKNKLDTSDEGKEIIDCIQS